MTKMLNTKAFEQWLKAQGEIIVRYRQVEKSDILTEYNTLKEVVTSTDFQAKKSNIRKNLLGKWRWLSTPEHQQEKRLQALAKNKDIQLYYEYKEELIAQLESYKTVWVEEFEGGTMSSEWETGFLYPSKEINANHSHFSEHQAYTQGKNTKVSGSVFSLLTKKENATAPAWHPTRGMSLQDFAYTSDIWHTVKAVVPKSGVLQAKVRCSGKVKHVLCLANAKAQKALHLLPQNAQGEAIYTLVWNEKEIIRYINNQEISREKNALPGEDLHLVVRSYLPEGVKETGKLEIDWIRIYNN